MKNKIKEKDKIINECVKIIMEQKKSAKNCTLNILSTGIS